MKVTYSMNYKFDGKITTLHLDILINVVLFYVCIMKYDMEVGISATGVSTLMV
jgi:hypothetical protein